MIPREKSKIKSNEILQGNTSGNKFVHLNKISHGVLCWKNLTKLSVEEKRLYHEMFRKRKIIHTPPPPHPPRPQRSNLRTPIKRRLVSNLSQRSLTLVVLLEAVK